MKFILLLLLMACVQSLQAQFWKKRDSDTTTLVKREDYIKSHPDHFFIWPVLKQRNQNYELQITEPEKRTVGYYSNKPYSVGIGLYMFEIGAEIAFAVPLNEKKKEIYGESEASNFQLNLLGKRWGFDAYWQRYEGFYLKDSKVEVPANTPYVQRPDIRTRNLGLTANYIFNNKKFSFRAAYNFSERQLKSAGSFLMFGTIDDFKIAGDSAIQGNGYDEAFPSVSKIKIIDSFIFGAAPGYTYTLISNGFYINGTLAVGPALNFLTYTLEDGAVDNSARTNTLIALRIALGYNGERFFGGMSFTTQSQKTRFENVDLTSSFGSFKILFGYRMVERGLLKKRARDLEKQILR